jgi:hypothetical protein
MEELKKCPFCGGIAEAESMDNDAGWSGEGVQCLGCDANVSMPFSRYDHNGDLWSPEEVQKSRNLAREVAIRMWNRRTP